MNCILPNDYTAIKHGCKMQICNTLIPYYLEKIGYDMAEI